MKTSELIGRALDWAVIKAVYPGADAGAFWLNFSEANRHSVDWSLAGPIIEREGISLIDPNGFSGGWKGRIWIEAIQNFKDWSGPTPLIAAMRCFVASKLGDEVEIPNELGESK